MNCRSVKNKVDDFNNLLCMTKPTVVLGTESWLDSSISDDEVFPDNYISYRKDRNYHGGGVFILVDNTVSSSRLDIPVGSCEAVWCRVRLSNGKSLTLCSFYRPPGSSANVIVELSEMVETIQTDCLIIGGDFNVPEVSWNRYMLQTGVVTGVGREMINMVRTFALTQIVEEPTRGNNIFDLVLTDQPAWVK